MASLTIELDDDLMHRAQASSEKLGKSLPELISAYLADLGAEARSTKSEATSRFGCLRGTAEIVGDIVSPIPDQDWDALRS